MALTTHIQPAAPAARSPDAGFTIIELIVAVGVVLVLLAILIPALRGARVAAGRSLMLSNLKGIAHIFEVYTQINRDVFPFHPAEEWYRLSPPDEPYAQHMSTSDPWAMSLHWPSAFHAIAPWREHYRSWINDGRPVNDAAPWVRDESLGNSGIVSYAYSCSFIARPEAWSTDPNPAPDADTLTRPTRRPEVTHPASKALCIDADRAYLRRPPRDDDPRGVLMADGSASLRLDSSAAAPVRNRIDARPPQVYHDTPGGIRGRDAR